MVCFYFCFLFFFLISSSFIRFCCCCCSLTIRKNNHQVDVNTVFLKFIGKSKLHDVHVQCIYIYLCMHRQFYCTSTFLPCNDFSFFFRSNRKCGIEKPMKKQFSTVFAFHPLSGKRFSLGPFIFHRSLLRLNERRECKKKTEKEYKRTRSKRFLLYTVEPSQLRKLKKLIESQSHTCVTLYSKCRVFKFQQKCQLSFCTVIFRCVCAQI